ncbi:MAG: hypothetical protein KF734_22370 [Saprospiraceae bacterium]|nr:hypothetical protein [Saprospiraceae bacterium]
MKRIALLLLVLSVFFELKAQTSHPPNDSATCLQNLLRCGKFTGHARLFGMATDNSGGLTDYYGIAAGVGLGYVTPAIAGFEAGISGFMIFNLASSDLAMRDSLTGMPNRYEIGLFDIENPHNTTDLDRTEELFLRWKKDNLASVTVGRFVPKSPFINPQDGRMRPTLAQGIWIEAGPGEKWRAHAAWLGGFSPRSTVRWFKTGESIGVYPSGFNPDGSRSDYRGHLESKGVFIAAMEAQLSEGVRLQAWNHFTENIFNTAWLELSAEHKLANGATLYAKAQGIRQDALRDGGNADPTKTYFEKGGHAEVFGLRLGLREQHRHFNLNYTRITPSGRYLMPREWGRDPHYTFLPRERNEGFGDVHAFSMNAETIRRGWQYALGAGYYDLPDALNARLNKYAMPSYIQLNVSIRHHFHKMLEGLEGTLLVVHKVGTGNTYEKPGLIFNKVDMTLFNLVLDYHF